MSLYDKPEGGDFLPYAKYNAKAGRWYVKKDGEEQEVVNPSFVADFKNVKKVWAHFLEGQAPDIIEFSSFDEKLPRPTEHHKQGIKLQIFSSSNFGGVVEFCSTASNACGPISKLYEAYLAHPNKDELPVVVVSGAKPISGKYGTNYEPVMVIEKFISRPVEFDQPANDAPIEEAKPAQSASEF